MIYKKKRKRKNKKNGNDMPKSANVKRCLKDMNNTVNKRSENLKFQNDLNNKKKLSKMFN